jgi:hypothetical protein
MLCVVRIMVVIILVRMLVVILRVLQHVLSIANQSVVGIQRQPALTNRLWWFVVLDRRSILKFRQSALHSR